tara:strand:+ start:964 stop:1707 length:744 start_codon:yes stop_codon:yes gene_type:complete
MLKMETLFLLFGLAFFAQIVGTVAGFGSSTIFLPLSLFFIDFHFAIVLTAIFHLFGNLSKIVLFKKGLVKNLALKFGIPSIILAFFGAIITNFVSSDLLKLILGTFLVLYIFYSFFKPSFSINQSTKNSIIGGSLSGFFAGIIGTGGAIRGAFLTSFNLEKTKYIATSAAIAFAIDITRIPVYLSNGFFDKAFIWMIPLLFIIAISGAFFGKLIVNKLPQSIFKKFVLSMLLLISIKLIYDSLTYFF